MIGIILAGGYGTRLYPLTKRIAKPLLEISDKPIIDYIMEKLVELDLEKILVAVNMRFKDQFLEWLENRDYLGVELRVEPSRDEGEKLGAIRGLSRLLDEVKDDCVIVAGDNLFTSSLIGFKEFYLEKRAPVVGLHDIGDLDKVRSLSMAEVDQEGRITRFIEKPEKPTSTLVGIGVYMLPERSFKRINEYLEEGNNPDSPGFFIQWLCSREPVYGYILEGHWWDIGTPEAYYEAKRFLEGARNLSKPL
ncbi:MAG TPA: nucleotidyltransferase family protein [Nitrososphaeria archaeon]|nr:MAG: nucleotidyltransferase family protein [Candidatus Bathyarchaeota archaeon]HDJ66459.1 nucleotidyltransferase family protein [Nitrososphaeria archaeon]